MGPVADEDVGSCIDHRAGELLKVRSLVVGVDRHEDVVGQPRGVTHDRGDFLYVTGIGLAVLAGLLAGQNSVAEDRQTGPDRTNHHQHKALGRSSQHTHSHRHHPGLCRTDQAGPTGAGRPG